MFDFNVNDYVQEDPTSSINLIPPGKYAAKIVAAEIVPTKGNLDGNNDSENLYIEYEILNDEHQEGKIVKEWLCIKNVNDFSQKIAREKLSRLALTVGLSQLTNADQLLRKYLYIFLAIEEPRDKENSKYGPRNKIEKYLKAGKETKIVEPKTSEEPFKDAIPF